MLSAECEPCCALGANHAEATDYRHVVRVLQQMAEAAIDDREYAHRGVETRTAAVMSSMTPR